MWFDLAERRGFRTVAELKHYMSAAEMTQWLAYYAMIAAESK